MVQVQLFWCVLSVLFMGAHSQGPQTYQPFQCPMTTVCKCFVSVSNPMSTNSNEARAVLVLCRPDVTGGHFNVLPELHQRNFPVTAVHINRYTKPNIPAGYLRGLEYLNQVNLTYNYFTKIPDGVKDSSMQLLDMSNNRIEFYLHETPWKNPYLAQLALSNNRISKIYEHSFSNLTGLYLLHLQRNRISSIEPKSFDNNKKLVLVVLSYNKIRNLDANLFNSLHNLTQLDLGHNNINHLDKDMFKYQHQLKALFLQANELTTLHETLFSNLQSLHSLHLALNKLTRVPPAVLTNQQEIAYLSLEGNAMTSVEDLELQHMEKLSVLNLSFMNISRLPDLSSLSGLTILSIAGTGISRIYQCELSTLKALQVVLLSYSPLRCDCDMRWLRTWFDEVAVPYVISGNYHQAFRLEDMICHQPLAVAGKRFLDIATKDFKCPGNQVPMYCHHPPALNTTSAVPTGTPDPNHLDPSIGAQNQSEAWTLSLSVKSFNKHQLVLTWNAPTPEQEVAQLQLTYDDVKHARQHQIYLTPDKTEISLSNYPRDATFVCLITYDNQHTALTHSCLNLTLNNSNATNSDTVLLVMMMLCLVGGVTFILIMKFKHMCKFSGVELKLPATRPSAGAERLT